MATGSPQVVQLFMLGNGLFEYPLNIHRIIEWLNLPINPIDRGLRRALCNALTESGGINNAEWNKAMNDYNRLKSSSPYLNATQIQMPCFLHEGIEQFKQVVKEFKTEGAHQVLLQICGISSSLEVHEIRFKEMCIILKVIEEHFEKHQVAEKLVLHVTSALDKDYCKNVDIVWGLSHHKSAKIDGREVNIIVGYN